MSSRSSSESSSERPLPAVKFKRLGVCETLADDAATCIVAHPKFLAIGTQRGRVLVVDTEEGHEIKRIAAHTAPVRDISVDDAGEHIASCSDSGKVTVHGLYTESRNEFSFGQAVLTVALDPEYTRKRTAVINVAASTQVYSGGAGRQLMVTTKGFLGWKDSAVQAAEGPVLQARWRGNVLAWATAAAVRFLDTRRNAPLGEVDLPPGPHAAPASLAWDARGTLLAAAAGSGVRLVAVRERSPEVLAAYDAGGPLAGACPFGDELVAELSVAEAAGPRLRLRPRGGGEAASEEAVPLDGAAPPPAAACRLAGSATGEARAYVAAGAGAVLASAAGARERVDWLLERGRAEEALRAAEEDRRALSDEAFAAVGDAVVASLLEAGAGDEAAAALPRVCGASAAAWERHARALIRAGHGLAVGEALPGEGPAIPRGVYDDCLLRALDAGAHEQMAAWLRRWAPDRVTPRTILPRALAALAAGRSGALADAVCLLHEREGDHAAALELALRRGPGPRPAAALDPFAYIARHELYEAVRPRLAALAELDPPAALRMLLAAPQRFPPAEVAAQLAGRPALLRDYLAGLFEKDAAALPPALHGRLVELLAEHEPARLEPFLRASSAYPLEAALAACRRRGLVRPQVFLLGRAGDTRAALALLVEPLRDVPAALDFVERQEDDALWDDLVSQCLAAREPEELLAALLEHIGRYTDPLRLVSRIPPGLRLPGLHLKLAKIVADYSMQVALQEGAAAAVRQDALALFRSVLHERRRGVRVGVPPRLAAASAAAEGPHATVCPLCGKAAGPSRGASLAVFFCGHAFHHGCIRAACEGGRRGPRASPSEADVWCVECETRAAASASVSALATALDAA